MKIIGEKINGTRKRVAQAIAERDAEFIKDLAKKQAAAGSTWLDVNAGTHPDREPDDLIWLIENIQSVVDTPLSLDSANPKALQIAIKAVNKTPMINSISGEPERLTNILPIVAEHGCPVIALAMDEKKIPETAEKRFEVITKIIKATRALGIPDFKSVFRSAGDDHFHQYAERHDRLRNHAPGAAGISRSAPDHRAEQYLVWAAGAFVCQSLFPEPGHPGRAGQRHPRPARP